MALFTRPQNGFLRLFNESSSLPIYDESITLTTNVTAGDPITLPNSGVYNGAELEVYLDGQVLEPSNDYNYVGTGSNKTQIQFTFNLQIGDNIRFRIIRGA